MAQGDSDAVRKYMCSHYKRKCRLVAPCCNKIYTCRFCHNENEDHEMNRRAVTEVECMCCLEKQTVRRNCQYCGINFGNYFCDLCKLYDDEMKGQFHCVRCGLCRIGGKQFFFHCDICDTCINNNLKFRHKCIERATRQECPVCVENLHTSIISLSILSCGHFIHKKCLDDLKNNGKDFCPICIQPLDPDPPGNPSASQTRKPECY